MGNKSKDISLTPLAKEQYEVLLSSIRGVANDISSLDRDLEKDRADLQDFKIHLLGLENEIRELRKSVNLTSNRVRDKVADVVYPIQEEVTGAVGELKEAVEKKKVIALKIKKGKGIISRLLRR